jgi:tetratricopeptide (TPR) repeat protein
MGRRLGVSEDYLATGKERDEDASVLIEAELALRLDEPEVAATLYQEALERAATKDERARALAGLGQIAFRAGKPREAINRFEEARVLWQDGVANHPGTADSLGRAYAMVDQMESSIATFRESLAAAESQNDPAETIRFAVLLANALIDVEDFAPARELLERTVTIAPDSNDPIFRARVYWSHSRLHTAQGDTVLAARYGRKALNLLELTEHTYYTAIAHQLLAHIEVDRKRPGEALELVETGLELLGDSGHEIDQALFRLEGARALIQLGRLEEAASTAMEASAQLADGSPHDAGRGYMLIGDVFRELGDAAKARELYELAAEVLEALQTRYLSEVYQKLAELLEEDGKKDEALVVLKKAVAIQSKPLR